MAWGQPFIDAHLRDSLTDDVVQWAEREGLVSQDVKLRNLAARVIEEGYGEIEGDLWFRINVLLGRGEENRFVRYRLAFALCARNQDRCSLVRATIQEAASDPDIDADMAENALLYLELDWSEGE